MAGTKPGSDVDAARGGLHDQRCHRQAECGHRLCRHPRSGRAGPGRHAQALCGLQGGGAALCPGRLGHDQPCVCAPARQRGHSGRRRLGDTERVAPALGLERSDAQRREGLHNTPGRGPVFRFRRDRDRRAGTNQDRNTGHGRRVAVLWLPRAGQLRVGRGPLCHQRQGAAVRAAHRRHFVAAQQVDEIHPHDQWLPV